MRLVSLRAFVSAVLVCALVATTTTSAAAQTFNISEIEEGPERSITCPDGKTHTTKLRPKDASRMAEFDVAFCIMIANVGNQTPTTPAPAEPVPGEQPVGAPSTCGGELVTIWGTTGDDRIFGTDGDDVIHGLQGHDWIDGNGGDDVICGGTGHDVLEGGLGFDVLYGAQGNDRLLANEDNGGGDDILGSRMFGGAGHDYIKGSNRWDRMQGGAGHDLLWDGEQTGGANGRDWMRGGAGNDEFWSGGLDDLGGGPGVDRYNYNLAEVRFSQGVDVCTVLPNAGAFVEDPDLIGCEEWALPAGYQNDNYGSLPGPESDNYDTYTGSDGVFAKTAWAARSRANYYRDVADIEGTGGAWIFGDRLVGD